MELTAALGIPFGAAGWLALLLHTFAIECYVSNHTPDFTRIASVAKRRRNVLMRSEMIAKTHAQRIQPLASSKLRPPTRTRYVEAWIRRPNSRAIRRRGTISPGNRSFKRARSRKVRTRIKRLYSQKRASKGRLPRYCKTISAQPCKGVLESFWQRVGISTVGCFLSFCG